MWIINSEIQYIMQIFITKYVIANALEYFETYIPNTCQS